MDVKSIPIKPKAVIRVKSIHKIYTMKPQILFNFMCRILVL